MIVCNKHVKKSSKALKLTVVQLLSSDFVNLDLNVQLTFKSFGNLIVSW